MKILNFGHRLHQQVLDELRSRNGAGEIDVEEVKIHLDLDREVGEQVARIIDALKTPLDGVEYIYVVLPGLPLAATLVVTEIHGRTGGFPRVIELRKDTYTGAFLLKDILDLNNRRIKARSKRN